MELFGGGGDDFAAGDIDQRNVHIDIGSNVEQFSLPSPEPGKTHF